MKNAVETFHSLSHLEGEMKRAEQAFVNADIRFQEAEATFKEAERRYSIVRRERDTALGALNECHMDIDRTVGMLREASPVGCEWRNGVDLGDGLDGRDVRDSRNAMALPADDALTFMLKD